MRDTSKLIVLFEGSDNRGYRRPRACVGLVYPAQNRKGPGVGGNYQRDQTLASHGLGAEPDGTYSGGSANYLFADTHVETISETAVYQWVQRDIAAGTNFALPH